MTAPPGDLVHFSRPWFDEREEKAVREAVCGQVSGDGPIGRRMEARLAELLGARRGLRVVEDAAQVMAARRRGRALGTLGDAGCLSFHETKNVTCGEGGALQATFHCVPLHSAPHARRLGLDTELPAADRVAATLLRLPLHPLLAPDDVDRVVAAVRETAR